MLAIINNVIAHIPSGAVLSGISVVVEAVLRMIPSQKPLSLLLFAQDAMKALGNLMGALAQALESILPQQLVSQPAAAPAAAPAVTPAAPSA